MSWGTTHSLQEAFRIMDDAKSEAALVAERARMRELLLRTTAALEAERDLSNSIMKELKAEEAGALDERRLSGTRNRDLRIAHITEQEEAHLQRLSDGVLHVDSERLRAARETKRAEAAQKKGSKP